VLRFRYLVVAFWLAALLAGAVASLHLRPLLANGFGVPHSDSQIAAGILTQHFGDRSDGEYLVVFTDDRPVSPAVRGQVRTSLERAARTVPSARVGPVEAAGRFLLYAPVDSQLDFAQAKLESAQLSSALRPPPGIRAYVSGQAAIQRDLDPVFSSDLHRGEFEIALPAALVVLLFVLGVSAVVTLPLIFAGATIAGTLGLVFVIAHATVLSTYVTNLVELIGLALAIDYSLLIVSRFGEELKTGDDVAEAFSSRARP
jgi:RND superfamily putative drug exporter